MPFDAPLPVLLASAAVAVALPLLFWGLAGIGRKGRRRRGGTAEGEEPEVLDEHQRQLQQPARQRLAGPLVRAVARRVRKLTPAGWVAALERRVRLAGSPKAWTVERALALKLFLAISTLLLGSLWVTRLAAPAGKPLLAVARIALVPLATLVAYLFPDLALRVRGRERQQAIQTALPDALDQMSISVEAGLGFDASLGRVVESGTGPLVEELHRTLQEIAIGAPRKQAFRNLVERTDVPELRHFVFAVNQAEEFGLPIAQVLRVQSKELRVVRRQRAEERAMKIPVKIVFPLVLCIFPALFVVLLVPAVIRIAEVIGK
jgi:tight adherence protein C